MIEVNPGLGPGTTTPPYPSCVHHPGLVVLAGNGLSIAHNPDLRLSVLTEQFLQAHASEGGLQRLLKEMGIEDKAASGDFEVVFGAVEAAEGVIQALMDLAAESPLSALQEAARVLRENDVSSVLRHLYYSYCAQILASIGDLARTEISKPVLAFGDWIKQMHARYRQTSIFTLNYDVLVERMLLSEDMLGLAASLTDCFSGIPDRRRQIELVPGADVVDCGLFFPYEPPRHRSIYLHHLHGCLTHFQDRQTGEVFKVDSTAVRTLGVFEYLAKNPGPFVPAIILGSRKVEKSTRWPFEFAFESLREAMRSAHVVCISGYSFRDAAVNERLTTAAEQNKPGERWIVIDRQRDKAEDFRARVEAVLPGIGIEWYLDGFEGALPPIELGDNTPKAAPVSCPPT